MSVDTEALKVAHASIAPLPFEVCDISAGGIVFMRTFRPGTKRLPPALRIPLNFLNQMGLDIGCGFQILPPSNDLDMAIAFARANEEPGDLWQIYPDVMNGSGSTEPQRPPWLWDNKKGFVQYDAQQKIYVSVSQEQREAEERRLQGVTGKLADAFQRDI